MSLLCRDLLVFAALLCVSQGRAAEAVPAAGGSTPQVIRIVSDANNLPFSNEKQEGFENRIADLFAKELHAQLDYTWRATRRGFMRQTLKEGDCDITMAAPKGLDHTLLTIPYYRSSYVFVTRKDRDLAIHTFDDPRLRDLKIGVQIVGMDGVNPAPAMALGNRGIVNNVVGFTVYGDYREPNPPERIVDAVANGQVDAAAVWGPLAGYFAQQSPKPLDITPVDTPPEPGIAYAFDICVVVRRSEPQLRDALDLIITRNMDAINQILDEYHIPHLPLDNPSSAGSPHD